MEYCYEELYQQWVSPYYFKFMMGRFLRGNPQDHDVLIALQAAVKQISDATIGELLQTRNWRHRLAGACFAGIKQQTQLVTIIGNLLSAGEMRHAAWGYHFALARFNTEASIKQLVRYLDAGAMRHHDGRVRWGELAALSWLDAQRGTNHAQKYLSPKVKWDQPGSQQFVTAPETLQQMAGIQQNFALLMTNCHHWFDE